MKTAAPSNAAWQVMMILAYHHHSKTGRCFPSYERMAEETGLAKSSVTRGVKELAAAGLIEVVKGRRAGTFNAPNSYKLLFLTHQKLLTPKDRRSSADDVPTTRPDREPTSTLRSEVGMAPKRKRAQKRAPKRRLEETWRPSPALMKQTLEKGFSAPEVERMILDFRDYYIARGEVSAVWGLDFSRWVRRQEDIRESRNAEEERRAATNGFGGRKSSTGDRLAEFYASVAGGSGGGDGREGGEPDDTA